MPEPPASEEAAEKAETAPTRQLHVAAIPIWIMYDAGRFFFALLPAILLGGAQTALFVVAPFVIAAPMIRYRRFRYQLTDAALTVQGGLLNRWQRVIPRERVQSVDVVEKLRHRIFNVVEVRVEAIGAQQTEAALVALDHDQAEQIKRWAGGTGPSEAGTEVRHPVLAQLGTKDLILAGVTGGRVAVLAVLLGYAQEFVGEDFPEQARAFVQELMPNTSLVTAAAILVLALVVVALLLSIVATVFVYWQFTLTLENDRLVIRRGLLERRRAQIPLKRIQAVQINENVVRRIMGLASVTVVVAGYNQQGQESEQTNMLLPIGRRRRAWEVAGQVLGTDQDLSQVLLRSRPVRAVLKNLVLLVVPASAAAAVASVAPGAALVAAPVVLVALGLAIALAHKMAGYALHDRFVILRSGVVVNTTTVVPRVNLQHIQLSWTATQHRFGLASLRLHIPRAVPKAKDIDQRQAELWFRRLRVTLAPEPEARDHVASPGD